MDEPLVCAVCLTKDRPRYLERAIRCFREQTHKNKRLYILDSGRNPSLESLPFSFPQYGILMHVTTSDNRTIGALRNYANEWCIRDGCDILMHWDDDDYSAPGRMAEQVALLRVNAVDAVGYNSMLFWDLTHQQAWRYRHPTPEYLIGTSLCYWRETWERKPFPDKHKGEDTLWQQGMRRAAQGGALTLIAEIHGGNTSSRIVEPSPEWTRTPEWDEELKARMAL